MSTEVIKVLIVEDEVNIREVYSEVMREEGFVVKESGDGLEGLALALSDPWDVLLLDIMLPKKDGLEVLVELKKLDQFKDKPIILLTNLGRESIIKEGMSHGAYNYLVKSEITPGDVVEAVKKAVSESTK